MVKSQIPHQARINNIPANLFATLNNIAIDKGKFNISRDDIERICRFFSIGKLKHFEKEKGVVFQHANPFVYVATTSGKYALKFYPTTDTKEIIIEHALNRFLIERHFPTPAMYTGHQKQPFLASNDRLITCYSYIDGLPAWQQNRQRKTIIQINNAMLSLKNILPATQGRIPFAKQQSLMAAIKIFYQTSQAIAPYGQKKMVDAYLKDACQLYQQHQPLFTRQWLHNNSTLANFLIDKKTAYTLDLTHVVEDYSLSDLTSLVIAYLTLKTPENTVKMVIQDYFSQHKLGKEYTSVLKALVQIELIRKYFRIVRREKTLDLFPYPTHFVRAFRSRLSARKKYITVLLQPRALKSLT